MLFSASRATVLSIVEEQLQIPVARKVVINNELSRYIPFACISLTHRLILSQLELDTVDELDEAELLESFHPKRAEVLTSKPAFARPARPGGRVTPRSRPGTPAQSGSTA